MVDKTSLLKKLFSKKTRDYTYSIIFFIVFSFFIVFVIKPNLTSIFIANNQIEELTKMDNYYEQQIMKIVNIQSTIENNRADFALLDEAFSSSAQINKVLSDISLSAVESSASIENLTIADVNLKDTSTQEKLKSMEVTVGLNGGFADSLVFVQSLYAQRRLKLVNDLLIQKTDLQANSPEASRSGSTHLKILLQVDGYYL